jgi:hypothetical protein
MRPPFFGRIRFAVLRPTSKRLLGTDGCAWWSPGMDSLSVKSRSRHIRPLAYPSPRAISSPWSRVKRSSYAIQSKWWDGAACDAALRGPWLRGAGIGGAHAVGDAHLVRLLGEKCPRIRQRNGEIRITARHSRNQNQILRYAALRFRRGGTCHPDPALREKDLLFFAPRDEVGAYWRSLSTPKLGAGASGGSCSLPGKPAGPLRHRAA